jgi:quercetin dioxygenase-like cupin family protein
MKIDGVPFATIDWSTVPVTLHTGETGSAQWRTVETAGMRIRMVDYSPGYLADHWCSKGHVILVLEGLLTTELRDGRTFELKMGESYVVGDGQEPHRSRTAVGARLFIVD